MKKKICIAITKGVWGGAQEYVYTLATSLPQNEFDVFVICGEGHVLQDKLEASGIRVYTIESLHRDISLLSEIKSYFAMRNILKKEKPDILHLNSSKMGLLGGILGRMLRIPKIVFTAHAWAFNEPRFSQPIKRMYWMMHFITILLSHKTIAVSNKTKADTRWMLGTGNKIVVIHNGLAGIEFLSKIEARKALQEMVRLSENTPVIIGTIAELHKNKDLDLLINSCRNLPHEASVYIIGEGTEREHLTELIEGFQLTHKVFLVGRVENARQYLKAFDIFTLTSRTEAMPYSLLEAGLAECAVVATHVGGIPEVISDEINGILIPRNMEHLSKVLHDLVADEEKRVHLGKALCETVSKNFSKEQMIEKTVEVYYNINV